MHGYSAPWVFTGDALLSEATVWVQPDGTLDRVVPGRDPDAEPHDGLLCPGFINAHCHLEFSHLQGEIPPHLGMAGFIRALTGLRDRDALPHRVAAARQALHTLRSGGVSVVVDTSNSAVGAQAAQGVSGIEVLPIVELFGVQDAGAEAAMAQGEALLSALPSALGLTPHAPYSVGPALFEGLRRHSLRSTARPRVWSYHLLESDEERRCVALSPEGPMAELFRSWGMPLNYAYPDPLAALRAFVPEGTHLGLVHLTQATEEDLSAIGALPAEVWYLLCPQANAYLHNQEPPYALFPPERICLGTDSLAGTYGFDLLEDLRWLARARPSLSAAQLLATLTVNPAHWLGRYPLYGSLRPGARGGLTLIENVTSRPLALTDSSTARRLI